MGFYELEQWNVGIMCISILPIFQYSNFPSLVTKRIRSAILQFFILISEDIFQCKIIYLAVFFQYVHIQIVFFAEDK